MFKLFSKKASTTSIERVATAVIGTGLAHQQKNYPKEVLEIHNEFFTAADRMVAEAQKIIDEAQSKNVSKTEVLKRLGFKQAREVAELEPLVKKAALSKEIVEAISYYKKQYPFQKFITEEQVQQICHKYNLVCGDVSRYKGFVPEKNLKEIERFSLKPAEKDLFVVEAFKGRKSIGIFSASNVEIKEGHGYAVLYKKNTNDRAFQQNIGEDLSEMYGEDWNNLFGLKEYGHINVRVLNKGLQICAPVKDMDISGLELENGYKLIKKHIPDPIVLQPVKHGYLILTAWGDEASDPIVVNEINN